MPVIKMAKEYITQHFCECISLSEVADYCNVNSSYLSNLFHKQLGISYSKYLMQIRMERAAAYLKDSPEIKIYEIGEKLGFVSTKHFISVFKKYYGISPTTYQREQRGSQGVMTLTNNQIKPYIIEKMSCIHKIFLQYKT